MIDYLNNNKYWENME